MNSTLWKNLNCTRARLCNTCSRKHRAETPSQSDRAPRRALALPELWTRPALSRGLPDAARLSGMRAFLFSGTGLLRGRDDYQLCGHHCGGPRDIFGISLIPRFHNAINEFQNPAVDGFCGCSVSIVRAACLQLLARHRFLDQAQKARKVECRTGFSLSGLDSQPSTNENHPD